MNLPIQISSSTLDDLASAMSKLLPVLAVWVRQWMQRTSWTSYETERLSLCLRIHDVRGERAELERVQEIRFRATEAGVIRDVAWGEGELVGRYAASGGKLLSVRREGARRVLLVGLSHAASRGERATVRSRRVIVRGLSRSEEYLEAQVERPTNRLSVSVQFPHGRAPRQAQLVTSPPGPVEHIPIQYEPDGRALLSWETHRPLTWRFYRLTWIW